MSVGDEKHGVVMICAREPGSLLMSTGKPFTWLPRLYEPGEASDKKIIDITRAENASLTGFVTGHSETKDFVKAAQHGTVAASFVLEQIRV